MPVWISSTDIFSTLSSRNQYDKKLEPFQEESEFDFFLMFNGDSFSLPITEESMHWGLELQAGFGYNEYRG